jgi:hypothetical protein
MKFNRVAGALLCVAGIGGYFTVADDLRHVGEFVGVTGILVSGLILLAASTDHRALKTLPLRWTALGILCGLPIGGFLDNMFLGVAIGAVSGALAGFALRHWRRVEIAQLE